MDASQQDIIERYTLILALCEQMLSHAEAGDWANLIAVESDHLHMVEQLAEAERDIVNSEAYRDAKRGLLVQIRATEQELRARLQMRMAQLSETIAQSRNTQRVKQAYEAGTNY